MDNRVLITIIVPAAAIVAVVLLTMALFGCAATGPSSSATDWRSIHQRSPDTGS
jgi:hypothetical protein